MPVANNILTGAILAPLLAILSALSLTSLQRGLEYISHLAKTPQKGVLRDLKPYIKQVDTVLERIFAGQKFSVTTTNILLMAVVILLLALLLEGSEKPKKVQVVKKAAEKSD